MKIALSAETTIDLPKELLEEYNIHTLPFTLFLGDKLYDDGEISTDEIIDFVNRTKILPKTGAVNITAFSGHFEKLLKDYDAVIHVSLSSELSSAYNNAQNAAKGFKNVFVIDSRSLSTGIALLVIYARKLVDEGYAPDKIAEMIRKRVPFVQASFELKRLDYLYKGGRCSSLVYFGANILKIRPQIIVKDGKMVSGKKYRGTFERVVDNYCEDTLLEFNNPDYSVAFVTYTTAEQPVLDCAVGYLKDAGFKKIYVTRAGGTITSHCGENCLGILYINDGGEK